MKHWDRQDWTFFTLMVTTVVVGVVTLLLISADMADKDKKCEARDLVHIQGYCIEGEKP